MSRDVFVGFVGGLLTAILTAVTAQTPDPPEPGPVDLPAETTTRTLESCETDLARARRLMEVIDQDALRWRVQALNLQAELER